MTLNPVTCSGIPPSPKTLLRSTSFPILKRTEIHKRNLTKPDTHTTAGILFSQYAQLVDPDSPQASSLIDTTATTQAKYNQKLIASNITEEFRTLFMDVFMNQKIKTLYLPNYVIGSMDAILLAEALQRNTTVTSLNLNYNDIGDQGTKAIAKALENSITLKLLNLGNNEIEAAIAKAIAKALQKNKTIISLNLYYNKIGDQGASAIAKALEKNTTLTSLSLAYNDIGAVGASAIAKALEKNTTLTSLILDYNDIGDQGASAIANALQNNSTLTSLDLSVNNIGYQGASAIAKALQNNSTLTFLYLTSNSIGGESLLAIANALENNSTLTSIKRSLVCGEPISDDYIDILTKQQPSVIKNFMDEVKFKLDSSIDYDLNEKLNRTLDTLQKILDNKLIEACKQTELTPISDLLSNGADINAKDNFKNTALHLATLKGKFHLCKFLIDRHASVNEKNQDGGTALHLAATIRDNEKVARKICKLLLENNSNKESRDNQGKTPYDLIPNKTSKIAKLLNPNPVQSARQSWLGRLRHNTTPLMHDYIPLLDASQIPPLCSPSTQVPTQDLDSYAEQVPNPLTMY